MYNTNKEISKAILVVLPSLTTIIGDQAFAQTPNRGVASQRSQPSCAGWNLALPSFVSLQIRLIPTRTIALMPASGTSWRAVVLFAIHDL